MNVPLPDGPEPLCGIGVVAPFDFALDHELWRWVPEGISLHLTRTPFVPVQVGLDLARIVSERETLRSATRSLFAVRPSAMAYACTLGSFVGGMTGERTMTAVMAGEAGGVPAVTSSGAVLAALHELRARRIAVITPYTSSVTAVLVEYLAEAGIEVCGHGQLGLTGEIWRVGHREVIELARATMATVAASPEALFVSCTNLHTYDLIPQLEAELRIPVISANQVTMWDALRSIGRAAVGPYQYLLDPAARFSESAPAGLADGLAGLPAAPREPELPRTAEDGPGPPR
ncbi:maleate cis-trans isomerase family protein [Streptomyces aidingensis]|uniref:Maleate isomerase n=1 Tax=Streptomyces aidingensis TaxID=910347 RepID=A0A1I1RN86_9ACTN|nr:decarboxylase [Streptomyces aidingensis]SFD33748.1 maleate isomerase [Streptomyces aidingensis]